MVTGARARVALSDIFVTVAPANIRQTAIILHSIGVRGSGEINAHTFSIVARASYPREGGGAGTVFATRRRKISENDGGKPREFIYIRIHAMREM